MSFELPDPSTISRLPDASKASILDNLFEPCPTLTKLLIEKLFSQQQQYASYRRLIEAARTELLAYLDEAEAAPGEISKDISLIIAAHPRLGAPKKTESLSEHSSQEQKSLQGSHEDQQKLQQLNEAYETQFPGLRYVVFVNGRPRSEIMRDMKNRIDRNNIQLERRDAFNAMCDIALDRARKLGARL